MQHVAEKELMCYWANYVDILESSRRHMGENTGNFLFHCFHLQTDPLKGLCECLRTRVQC